MSQGPILIFDKSTLQSLNIDEACWLGNFFLTNITPLFYIETLADLEKEIMDGRTPEQVVGNIAKKTPIMGSFPNVHHSRLCTTDLLGGDVEMQGRPIIEHAIPVTTGDKTGIFFREAPETEALKRWQRGEFLDLERQAACIWRQSLTNLDLDTPTHNLQKLFPTIGEAKTLTDVKTSIDEFVNDESRKAETIWLILGLLGTPKDSHADILQRWKAEGRPRLPLFAPYATHVFTVDLFFYLSIAAGLISRERPSNKIDLAYLYYLPFCMVFTSNDNLHARTVPLFLSQDQSFLNGSDLKADLKRLDNHYSSLSDDIKKRGIMSFASYPPLEGEYLVAQLWDKHLPMWRTHATENEQGINVKIDKETKSQLVQQILQFKNQARPADPSTNIDSDSADNVIFERKVPVRVGKWRIIPPEAESQGKTQNN